MTAVDEIVEPFAVGEAGAEGEASNGHSRKRIVLSEEQKGYICQWYGRRPRHQIAKDLNISVPTLDRTIAVLREEGRMKVYAPRGGAMHTAVAQAQQTEPRVEALQQEDAPKVGKCSHYRLCGNDDYIAEHFHGFFDTHPHAEPDHQYQVCRDCGDVLYVHVPFLDTYLAPIGSAVEKHDPKFMSARKGREAAQRGVPREQDGFSITEDEESEPVLLFPDLEDTPEPELDPAPAPEREPHRWSLDHVCPHCGADFNAANRKGHRFNALDEILCPDPMEDDDEEEADEDENDQPDRALEWAPESAAQDQVDLESAGAPVADRVITDNLAGQLRFAHSSIRELVLQVAAKEEALKALRAELEGLLGRVRVAELERDNALLRLENERLRRGVAAVVGGVHGVEVRVHGANGIKVVP